MSEEPWVPRRGLWAQKDTRPPQDHTQDLVQHQRSGSSPGCLQQAPALCTDKYY